MSTAAPAQRKAGGVHARSAQARAQRLRSGSALRRYGPEYRFLPLSPGAGDVGRWQQWSELRWHLTMRGWMRR